MAACGSGDATAPTMALSLRCLLCFIVFVGKLANSYELPGTPILVGGPTSDRSYVSASPQLVHDETSDFSTPNANIDSIFTSSSSSSSSSSSTAEDALDERNSDSGSRDEATQLVSDDDSSLSSPIGAQFTTKLATIIRTRESLNSGASFINYTLVTSLNACLVECWITDSCDTLIYQESPVDFNNHLPSSSSQGSFSALNSPKVLSAASNHNHKRHRLESRENHKSVSQEPHLQAYLKQHPQYHHPERARHHRHHTKHRPAHQQQQTTSKPSNYYDYSEQTQSTSTLRPEDGNSDDYKQKSKPQRSTNELLDLPQTFTDGGSGFFVCYLFQCAKQDGFKCQFSPHNYYISSTKLTSTRRDYKHLSKTSSKSFIQLAADDEAASARETIVTLKNSHILTQHQQPQQQQPVRYSNIINQASQHHWLNRHDSHIASIRIGGHEELAHLGGVNSAIIAILMGIGVTGVLMIIVGHKMKSIRKRIAHKRRRALPANQASAPVDLLTSNSAASLLMTF